jgi:hypothetical protein
MGVGKVTKEEKALHVYSDAKKKKKPKQQSGDTQRGWLRLEKHGVRQQKFLTDEGSTSTLE